MCQGLFTKQFRFYPVQTRFILIVTSRNMPGNLGRLFFCELNQISRKKVVSLTNIEPVDILWPAKERGQACITTQVDRLKAEDC